MSLTFNKTEALIKTQNPSDIAAVVQNNHIHVGVSDRFASKVFLLWLDMNSKPVGEPQEIVNYTNVIILLT